MVLLETPICDLAKKQLILYYLVLTDLLGRYNNAWRKGFVDYVYCNHCPYVKAVQERIVRDALELNSFGIESVASCQ